ncbi:MAG: DEAD/DEAH box helicase family protein, partial [Chlamydiia bacterium]|nr:DEAD/DEAH box helicase family protein [Chlamydiia bacterium]
MRMPMSKEPYVSVILDKGLDMPLDYASIDAAEIGSRVLVPVQNSLRKGTVVAFKETPSVQNVQPIREVLSEEPLVGPDLFALAEWMSRYYCTSMRRALKVILPGAVRKETKEKTQLFVRRLIGPKEMTELAVKLRAKHPSQAKVLDVLLKKPKGVLLTELLELAATSKSPITTLEKQNILSLETLQIDRSPLEEMEFFPTKPKTLKGEQQEALDNILSHLNTFKTHLIHGVTGSGKTEVYLQAIGEARKR